jgi:flavin-dependent dehydrogenase
MRESVQVLVVGGGPSGSTAATLLARQGFTVTLLEQENFPRYHIGESLLPSCLPVLDLLGVRDKIEAHGFKRKGGAYFAWGSENWELRFNELFGTPYSWQVVRSEFDNLLLQHSRENEVDVQEGITVKKINFNGEGRAVSADWERSDRSERGTIAFEYVLDASGRAGLLATKHHDSRRMHDVFKNVALWGYWKNAKTLDRGPEGAIGVASIPHGWLWEIPLQDERLSVGAVISKQHLREQQAQGVPVSKIYHDKIAESELVTDLLEKAELVTEIKAESDYSYVTENFGGPGYLLSGDAACFLDPLLSTGVHLAMFSAVLATATISSILRESIPEQEGLDFYAKAYRTSYERLLIVVSLFYQNYRGRDEQFYEAQQLTASEKHRLNLHEAFLHIVTGVEDLADAKESAFDKVADALAPKGNPLGVHGENMLTGPDSPEKALSGLYLSMEPKVELLRA